MKQSVLLSMRDAYAAATDYEDRGVVRENSCGRSAVIGSFVTRFDRHRRLFQFEFFRYDVEDFFSFRLDDQTLTRLSPHSIQASAVNEVVAKLTGVTLGCAHNVLGMLMPSMLGGRPLWDWPPSAAARLGVQRGMPCWVVNVVGPPSQEILVRDKDWVLLGHTMHGGAVGARITEAAKLRGHDVPLDLPSPTIVVEYDPVLRMP